MGLGLLSTHLLEKVEMSVVAFKKKLSSPTFKNCLLEKKKLIKTGLIHSNTNKTFKNHKINPKIDVKKVLAQLILCYLRSINVLTS